MIFAPRSCPSSPGLATTTRILLFDAASMRRALYEEQLITGVRSRELGVGALLVAALVVRLAGAGDRLSADEGYTWLVTSAHGFGTFLDRIAAFENTPPLYYLLTWPLPDGDEVWLRVVAILAGVGCVAALWWAVRALADERAALLAAAALAVAPYAVSFSNYGRGFVLADLGLVIALGAAIRRSWWVY